MLALPRGAATSGGGGAPYTAPWRGLIISVSPGTGNSLPSDGSGTTLRAGAAATDAVALGAVPASPLWQAPSAAPALANAKSAGASRSAGNQRSCGFRKALRSSASQNGQLTSLRLTCRAQPGHGRRFGTAIRTRSQSGTSASRLAVARAPDPRNPAGDAPKRRFCPALLRRAPRLPQRRRDQEGAGAMQGIRTAVRVRAWEARLVLLPHGLHDTRLPVLSVPTLSHASPLAGTMTRPHPKIFARSSLSSRA